MTFVWTIQYSGTHFALKFLLGVLGLDGRSDDVNPNSNCDFLHKHPAEGSLPEPKPSEFCDAVIITLRHPHKIVQTGKWTGFKAEAIARSWVLFQEEINNFDIVLPIVIDGPKKNRRPQLMAITKHFGKEHLETQVNEYADAWVPVNQTLSRGDIDDVRAASLVYKQWPL